MQIACIPTSHGASLLLESVHKTLYMAATGPPALAPETPVIEK
jgi:hypothetical protein